MEEIKKTDQTLGQDQTVTCTKCRKLVHVKDGVNTLKGFVCNSCAKKSKKRKLLASAGAIVVAAVTIGGGIYYNTTLHKDKTAVGFSGVSQINDSANVQVDDINVDMILSTRTATSDATSTQTPISNLTDYKQAINRNVVEASKNKDGKIVLPSVCVMFAINTNYFVNNGEELIKELATTYLKTDGKAKLLVEGYTCDLGDDKLNMNLSKLRSEAVKNILVTAGIPKDKIDIKWYGKSRFKDFHYSAKEDYRRVVVSFE